MTTAKIVCVAGPRASEFDNRIGVRGTIERGTIDGTTRFRPNGSDGNGWLNMQGKPINQYDGTISVTTRFGNTFTFRPLETT